MRLGCREPSFTSAGLHDGGGTTVQPGGTIVTLDRGIGWGLWSTCAPRVCRPAELVDKGKPRVTWGRKATGLGQPSQPGCRNQ